MLRSAGLILITLFLTYLAKRTLKRGLARKNDEYLRAKGAYEELWQENLKVKDQNMALEKVTEETIALYDLTKDICQSLDEEKVFAIFNEKAAKYMRLGDCKFLRAGGDLSAYQKYAVFPLLMQHTSIGNLLADIRPEDKEKFHILAQQFLIGIKRAMLYHQVQEASLTDSLTGAFSRRYFLEKFQEEVTRAKRNKLKTSFLMLDLDHLKPINDKFGHLVGDVVLSQVTKTIEGNIRQIDLLGRYGGEELAVVLAETDKEQACFAAERIRQAIEAKLIRAYEVELKTTISIGLATFPDDAKDPAGIIDKADAALYQAKASGRNRLVSA
jgi:diguanylate cyclase (GGDEF)-like protein